MYTMISADNCVSCRMRKMKCFTNLFILIKAGISAIRLCLPASHRSIGSAYSNVATRLSWSVLRCSSCCLVAVGLGVRLSLSPFLFCECACASAPTAHRSELPIFYQSSIDRVSITCVLFGTDSANISKYADN